MKKKYQPKILDILEFLKANKLYLKEQYGVSDIGVFGSFYRNENKPNSDIDILVEFREQRFNFWAGLKIFLEKELNTEIDLIIKAPYHAQNQYAKRFLNRIEKEIIYMNY